MNSQGTRKDALIAALGNQRYRLPLVLASNLLVPALGILLGGWDAMAMLVFYLAEFGVLLAVIWIYIVLKSKDSRATSLFFVGPMLAFFGYAMYRMFFVVFFHLSTHEGLTLAQIGERVHAERLGWGFVIALLVTALGHGWRLASASAKGGPYERMQTVVTSGEAGIHMVTIYFSCYLLWPFVMFKLGVLVALGFAAIRTYIEYQWTAFLLRAVETRG